jgi:pyruvate kinase
LAVGLHDSDDSIVVVCGFPFGVPGTTNSIRVIPLMADETAFA